MVWNYSDKNDCFTDQPSDSSAQTVPGWHRGKSDHIEDSPSAYAPQSGLVGKLKRQAAKRLAISPIAFERHSSLVSFSFDDFPKSAAITGAKILEDYGWRATYYASARYAGTHTHLGQMYDLDDLTRLSHRGHEIGCHSYNHKDGSRLSVDLTRDECARNRQAIRAVGYKDPLSTFAFPYGEANPFAKSALLETYKALRSVHPGINRTGSDRGFLKAVALDGGQAGLDKALTWIEEAKYKPGWLIFYGHDVCEDHSQWGCTPQFLATLCEVIKSNSMDVMPVAEAILDIEA